MKHDGSPALYMMPKGNAPTELAAATGIDARARFHNYIIVYNFSSLAEGGTIALWVDGIKVGEQSGYFSHGGNTECNFGRSNSNSSQFVNAYDNQSTGRGLEVDDFRVYAQALTEAEIKNVAAANAPWPMTGIAENPQVYLNLNGGYDDGNFKGTQGLAHWYSLPETWASTDEGEKKAYRYLGTHAGFRASGYSNLGKSDSSWTVLVRGRLGDEAENTVLFGLGHENNANSVVIASAGAGKVKIARTGDGTPSKGGHEDLATGEFANLTTQLHTFALVNNHNAATLSLYVDGTLVCSTDQYPSACAGNEFCLGRSNSTGNGNFKTALGTTVDDFRLYGSVLTAEEIAGYAEEYAVYPADPSDNVEDVVTIKDDFTNAVALVDVETPALVFDRLAVAGVFTVEVTLPSKPDTVNPYTIFTANTSLVDQNIAISVKGNREATAYLSDDGKSYLLSVLPLPTVAHKFNGTVAKVDRWGTQSFDTYNGFEGPDTNFLWNADNSNAAVMIQTNSICHVKGSFGLSQYNTDEWTLNMTVRSVDTENAALVIVGYANNTTSNVWGIVSAGVDKMEYRQWAKGSGDDTVLERYAFDVPQASQTFHNITLVHPKDSTGTDTSLSIYVDGNLVVTGNYYVKRGGPNNDITFGGMDGKLMPWKSDQTALGDVVRGVGAVLDDFRIYNVALSPIQVKALTTQFSAPWPVYKEIGADETLDASLAGGDTFTDTIIDCAAGSTLKLKARTEGENASLSFVSNYDLPVLRLPSEGQVTLSFIGVKDVNPLPATFTVIAGAKLSAEDQAKFVAVDDCGTRSVKLSVNEAGDLIGRIVNAGTMVIIR